VLEEELSQREEGRTWSVGLGGLIHVPLLGGIVDLDVAMDVLGGEAREAFKITFINCID
jgi:hypothetical protein